MYSGYRRRARTLKQQASDDRRARREASKEEAAARTSEAEQAIADLGGILQSVVEASPVYQIEQQRITGNFEERGPTQPAYQEYPREPKREDWTFVPELDFWDKLFAFRRNKKLRHGQEASENMFAKDYADWVIECKRIKQ